MAIKRLLSSTWWRGSNQEGGGRGWQERGIKMTFGGNRHLPSSVVISCHHNNCRRHLSRIAQHANSNKNLILYWIKKRRRRRHLAPSQVSRSDNVLCQSSRHLETVWPQRLETRFTREKKSVCCWLNFPVTTSRIAVKWLEWTFLLLSQIYSNLRLCRSYESYVTNAIPNVRTSSSDIIS